MYPIILSFLHTCHTVRNPLLSHAPMPTGLLIVFVGGVMLTEGCRWLCSIASIATLFMMAFSKGGIHLLLRGRHRLPDRRLMPPVDRCLVPTRLLVALNRPSGKKIEMESREVCCRDNG